MENKYKNGDLLTCKRGQIIVGACKFMPGDEFEIISANDTGFSIGDSYGRKLYVNHGSQADKGLVLVAAETKSVEDLVDRIVECASLQGQIDCEKSDPCVGKVTREGLRRRYDALEIEIKELKQKIMEACS